MQFNENMPCCRCNKPIKYNEYLELSDEHIICKKCMDSLSEGPNWCPVCGTECDQEGVGLELQLHGSGKAFANNGLVIVCPNCHAVFMDNWQANVIRWGKEAGIIRVDN